MATPPKKPAVTQHTPTPRPTEPDRPPQPPQPEPAAAMPPPVVMAAEEHEIHEGDTEGRFLGRWRRAAPRVEELGRHPWWTSEGIALHREPPPLVRPLLRSWSTNGNA